MNPQATPLDWLLCAALTALGSWLLFARDLYRSVVLFISFGLLLSLAWARLAAPDVALAEAVIGAGLTGAFLLHTVGALGGGGQGRDESERDG